MSENNQTSNNTEEPVIEGDRDIPSVAQNKDFTKLGVIGFIMVGIVAIILVAMDGLKDTQPQNMVTPEETMFKAAVSSTSGPYIEEPITEPDNSALNDPIQPAVNPMELQMAQEALRRAREAEKEAQRRIASPQVVFDKKSSTPFSVTNPSAVSGGGNLLGGDPNIAFANKFGNADVEMAQATKLRNLDALVAQGTMIDGILETAIQSDLPGMVRAIVSKDTYSFDGSNLLIPKGSRLIGRYSSGLVRGQSRVFIIWNRLLRPDGVSVNIGSYGTDDLGRAGLGGVVDTKFFERFGSSVLLSLLDAGIQIGVNAADDDDTATVALDSGSDFSRAAEIALENSIAIKPTVHVHQGTEIKVFVGKDLDFSNVGDDIGMR